MLGLPSKDLKYVRIRVKKWKPFVQAEVCSNSELTLSHVKERHMLTSHLLPSSLDSCTAGSRQDALVARAPTTKPFRVSAFSDLFPYPQPIGVFFFW